ncbi:MAG: SpoIIE family protein phosphatase [Bacteroidota bacterium]
MKKILLLFCFFSFAAILSAQNKNILRITKIDSSETIDLDKFWKFKNGDDATWASSSFDDSAWDTVDTNLEFNKNDSTVFAGLAWFRIHIYIDSSLNDSPIALMINQDGASQIFLDGKLLHSLGTVSKNSPTEQKYNPNEIPLSFRYHSAGEHILAIRYSNSDYQKHFKKYHTNNPGFTIKIGKQDDLVKDKLAARIIVTSIAVALGIFFLSLGFVHLLFFLFYRKHITNLYYSIFVFLFGSVFFIPAISFNSFDPELSITLNYYFWFFLSFFFYAMFVLHYSLFKRPVTKYFWFSTLILIAVLISLTFKSIEFTKYLLYSFIISTVVASFFMVIKSIRKKIDGAWIIGTGSLVFLLFLGFITIQLIFTDSFSVHSSIFYIVLIFIALISIPVSMSVYLARQFAMTNYDLEKKLVEVESLSAKSIEQEKEKQKILETQKETLEIQVKERTSEIVEQKKVIEEKNKDITDSINYAKNIQEAILPSNELKNKLFPDSFILFKPKDIVSGDFFWFAEKNNKKIIAACDCTGHGVPGALMSMIGNNILNQIVNEKGITSPDEILNHLHKEIRKTLNQEEQNDSRDGMDIAIITFNDQTEIEFAGAQRPLWIVAPPDLLKGEENQRTNQENLAFAFPSPSGRSGEASLTEIKGNKFAIGGAQSETERKFTKNKISLMKGDCLYIFTDGYADQFGSSNKKLMTKRFKEILISIQEKQMDEQKNFLEDFIEKWKGNTEQIDDILVIGIRI